MTESSRRPPIAVKGLYPIRGERRLMAVLASPDWDWGSFGPVDLLVGRRRIRLNYVAWGEAGRNVTIALTPFDTSLSIDDVLRVVAETGAPDVYVDRPLDSA